MFYQKEHSLDSRSFTSFKTGNMKFPVHLHEAFELITAEEGELLILVEGKRYRLHPGKAVLVFPEQIHSIDTPDSSLCSICIFSPEYIRSFMPFCCDHVPENNLFDLPDTLCAALSGLTKEDRILHIKSVLYALADVFDAQAVYRERCPEKEKLLQRIFDFVEKNYAGECTLTTLCKTLSYHYAYLSRYFSERTGLSFTEYVADYRINQSCIRLTRTQDSVTDIALECGYPSLRSFNRNFRKRMGCTPGAYRHRPEKDGK